jgi:hypothetical protein
VVASIDGLEDTNEIYRVNCSYNKAIENCKAFIDGGGKASWKFIAFEHNEHQINEARSISDDIGFDSFITVASSRFEQQAISVYTDKNGKLKKIAPPTESYISTDLKNEQSSCIECHATKRNEFFVDDKGVVMPCCWTAARIVQFKNLGNEGYAKKIWNKYPNLLSELNAIDNNIYDVFKHPFWNDLQLLWSIKEPRVCVSKCMKKSDDVHHHTKGEKTLGWRKI